MSEEASDQPVTIESFNPDKHDRTAFSCGVQQVDNYFRKTANKLRKADNVRLFVMTGSNKEVIGFYAINAHAVRYDELPNKHARNRPSHGNIPAAYISMIGRDEKYKGQSYGADLLVDAFRRIASASDQVGISIIMLDVLDCGDKAKTARRKALYESYGFQPLKSNPMRLFLPIAAVRSLISDL